MFYKNKDIGVEHPKDMDEKFHQLNLENIANVIYWEKFFEMINEVPGDIVECGIGRARSLMIICAINKLYGMQSRNVYGYDSFEGFPEPSKEDRSRRNPKKGEWSHSPSKKYKYSIKFTQYVLDLAQVSKNKNFPINLTKGYFGDTLSGHPNKPIALLHVDCDLYQSHMDVLTHLYSKMSPGGIIVFDDTIAELGNENFPGVERALKKFFGKDFSKLKISVGGTYYWRIT